MADASYVGSELTATCSHWFWPMSGGLDHLGRLAVFYVEMANEFGSGAAPPAHPVAVWIARFDAATLDLISFTPAPASCGQRRVRRGGRVGLVVQLPVRLVVRSVQPSGPHVAAAVADVRRARSRSARFDQQPLYWNGADWVRRSSRGGADQRDAGWRQQPDAAEA